MEKAERTPSPTTGSGRLGRRNGQSPRRLLRNLRVSLVRRRLRGKRDFPTLRHGSTRRLSSEWKRLSRWCRQDARNWRIRPMLWMLRGWWLRRLRWTRLRRRLTCFMGVGRNWKRRTGEFCLISPGVPPSPYPVYWNQDFSVGSCQSLHKSRVIVKVFKIKGLAFKFSTSSSYWPSLLTARWVGWVELLLRLSCQRSS